MMKEGREEGGDGKEENLGKRKDEIEILRRRGEELVQEIELMTMHNNNNSNNNSNNSNKGYFFCLSVCLSVCLCFFFQIFHFKRSVVDDVRRIRVAWALSENTLGWIRLISGSF